MNLNATLLIQTFVFIILGWVTMKFIWPPLIRAIDERRQKIADGLAAADRGNQSLGDAQKRIAAMEAEARAKAQTLIADSERRGQAIVDEARVQAKAEADRQIAAAKEEVEQQTVRAKNALRDQVAVLAIAGAEQILKREVNAQAHADLLNQLKARL